MIEVTIAVMPVILSMEVNVTVERVMVLTTDFTVVTVGAIKVVVLVAVIVAVTVLAGQIKLQTTLAAPVGLKRERNTNVDCTEMSVVAMVRSIMSMKFPRTPVTNTKRG